jgi:hypothetical protein
VTLFLAKDVVAMVKLLLGIAMVVANLLLAMAMSIMEKVLPAIAMPTMEAKVLLDVGVAATPTTHLLPRDVRVTKAVLRCTVALSVRTRSSPYPRRWEATLLIIIESWRTRARQRQTCRVFHTSAKCATMCARQGRNSVST